MQWPSEKEQMNKDLHYIENNSWSKTNPTNTGGDQYVLRKGVQFLCSFILYFFFIDVFSLME